MPRRSATTERLYGSALASFLEWNADRQFPVQPQGIASYLRSVRRYRGPTAVPVHLSAIARYYRKCGLSLDTKHPTIKRVTEAAREQARG